MSWCSSESWWKVISAPRDRVCRTDRLVLRDPGSTHHPQHTRSWHLGSDFTSAWRYLVIIIKPHIFLTRNLSFFSEHQAFSPAFSMSRDHNLWDVYSQFLSYTHIVYFFHKLHKNLIHTIHLSCPGSYGIKKFLQTKSNWLLWFVTKPGNTIVNTCGKLPLSQQTRPNLPFRILSWTFFLSLITCNRTSDSTSLETVPFSLTETRRTFSYEFAMMCFRPERGCDAKELHCLK